MRNPLRSVPAAVAILWLLPDPVLPVLAEDWTLTSAPITAWLALASSADGAELLGSSGYPDGSIYISMDSGAIWTPAGIAPHAFRGLACSGDGTTFLASGWDSAFGPVVCASTNAGAAWTTNAVAFTSFTGHLACSADGTKIVVAGGSLNVTTDFSPIFTSTNSGTTWISNSAPRTDWTAVASSADGTKLAAVGYGLPVFTSTNSGANWRSNNTPALTSWSAIASSADGNTLIAGDTTSGWIYTSTNSGANWTSNSFPAQHLFALACSADGTKLVAGCYPGPLYTSTDSGTTWVSNNLPSKSWISVVSSADGDKLAAAAATGEGIYTRQAAPAPVLSAVRSGGALRLSWTVPSRKFILQENADSTTTNWVDVAVTPVLDYTNLRYEVTAPSPPDAIFYRLVSR